MSNLEFGIPGTNDNGYHVVKMGRLWGVFHKSLLVGRRGYHTQKEAIELADELTANRLETYYDQNGVLMVGPDPRKETE